MYRRQDINKFVYYHNWCRGAECAPKSQLRKSSSKGCQAVQVAAAAAELQSMW